MAKEINEKTFELNIISELLNISKSFVWYLDCSPIRDLIPRDAWEQFLKSSVLYAEGLTQEQEANEGGGYDVSINVNNPFTSEKRLLMMQFKSGVRKHFHRKNIDSRFHISKKPEQYVEFKFNDAANKTQHIILRKLAQNPRIQGKSVIYVFPRITEMSDFQSKLGEIIWSTSFIPVLEIDEVAAIQSEPCVIEAGKENKYLTSYDGLLSEVNFFFFHFLYNNNIISLLISELICIQIERLLKYSSKIVNISNNPYIIDDISSLILNYLESNHNTMQLKESIFNGVKEYLKKVRNELRVNDIDLRIPRAPANFTNVIPNTGLKLLFKSKEDFSYVQYQIF